MIELKRIIFILQAALSKNSETYFMGNYSEKNQTEKSSRKVIH